MCEAEFDLSEKQSSCPRERRGSSSERSRVAVSVAWVFPAVLGLLLPPHPLKATFIRLLLCLQPSSNRTRPILCTFHTKSAPSPSDRTVWRAGRAEYENPRTHRHEEFRVVSRPIWTLNIQSSRRGAGSSLIGSYVDITIYGDWNYLGRSNRQSSRWKRPVLVDPTSEMSCQRRRLIYPRVWCRRPPHRFSFPPLLDDALPSLPLPGGLWLIIRSCRQRSEPLVRLTLMCLLLIPIISSRTLSCLS